MLPSDAALSASIEFASIEESSDLEDDSFLSASSTFWRTSFVVVEVAKTSFDVYILNWQKKNFRFSCFNLCKDIIPEDSYIKTTNRGLIIYLAKANKVSENRQNLIDFIQENEIWEFFEIKGNASCFG